MAIKTSGTNENINFQCVKMSPTIYILWKMIIIAIPQKVLI
jgi:hypothetical protein